MRCWRLNHWSINWTDQFLLYYGHFFLLLFEAFSFLQTDNWCPVVFLAPGDLQGPSSVCGRHQHTRPPPGQPGELLDGGCNFLLSFRDVTVEEGDAPESLSVHPGYFPAFIPVLFLLSLGDSRSQRSRVESQESRPLRWHLSFSILAARPLDGRRGGRPSSCQQGWNAALLPLGHAAGVLECSVGEGLRQVSWSGSNLN